jgi:hypothetical protein
MPVPFALVIHYGVATASSLCHTCESSFCREMRGFARGRIGYGDELGLS